jgi:hypothetical protein
MMFMMKPVIEEESIVQIATGETGSVGELAWWVLAIVVDANERPTEIDHHHVQHGKMPRTHAQHDEYRKNRTVLITHSSMDHSWPIQTFFGSQGLGRLHDLQRPTECIP